MKIDLMILLSICSVLVGCAKTDEKVKTLSNPMPPRGMTDGISFDNTQRTLVARGWVFSPDDPVQKLVFLIDGQPLRAVSPGAEARPDVAAALQDPRAAASGWTISAPVPTNLPAKTYRASVVAELLSGQRLQLESSGASRELSIPAYVAPQATPKKKAGEKNKKQEDGDW